jgi:hypothetical protein
MLLAPPLDRGLRETNRLQTEMFRRGAVLMERAPEVLGAPFASPQLHPSPSCGGGLQPTRRRRGSSPLASRGIRQTPREGRLASLLSGHAPWWGGPAALPLPRGSPRIFPASLVEQPARVPFYAAMTDGSRQAGLEVLDNAALPGEVGPRPRAYLHQMGTGRKRRRRVNRPSRVRCLTRTGRNGLAERREANLPLTDGFL